MRLTNVNQIFCEKSVLGWEEWGRWPNKENRKIQLKKIACLLRQVLLVCNRLFVVSNVLLID